MGTTDVSSVVCTAANVSYRVKCTGCNPNAATFALSAPPVIADGLGVRTYPIVAPAAAGSSRLALKAAAAAAGAVRV